jgi:hypothetical protein
MKRLNGFCHLGVLLISMMIFTGCSTDESEELMATTNAGSSVESRSARDIAYVITFEDATSSQLAGPTSYGANLYTGSYPGYNYIFDGGGTMSFGINTLNGTTAFYNGGIALSQWNIRSNTAGKTGDWWYSYDNQCSVYNTASTDGSNKGAGYNGSNTFAIMYGYSDFYNTEWISKPYITFSTPKSVSSMYICCSSYTYGVVINGNSWSSNPNSKAVSLVTTKGWFKVIATGYKQDGSTVTAEKYLCDYRDSANPKVPAISSWTQWRLNFEDVVKVEFNFESSDVGIYGLNTPAYLCIDNITVH